MINWEMALDEERQIIRQSIEGEPDVDEIHRFARETGNLAMRMRDPGTVRILIDARRMGKLDAKTRKLMQTAVPETTRVKIAMWGAGLMVRTIARMLTMTTSNQEIRFFAGESEAINWLCPGK